jgi:AcrR family transcriptional regulator
MTSVRKPRTRGRANSKPVSPEQIEHEAVRLFSEKTYPAVGMRDISDAVGLLPGSLYVHIKSKEELLLNIVERGIFNYLSALTPIAESDAPAAERLHKMVLTYMQVLDSSLDQTKVAIFQWRYLTEPSRQRIIELRAQFRQLFVGLIQDGISSGEFAALRHPSIVAIGIIGLLNSTMHWYSPSGQVSAVDIGEELTSMVLTGLTR